TARQSCVPAAALLILPLLRAALGQQFVVTAQTPSDCGGGSYFDASSLSCVTCGANQVPRLACECQTGHRLLFNSGGGVTCQPCPASSPAVTRDGYGCIRCPGPAGEDGRCQCPAGHDSFINSSLSCVCGGSSIQVQQHLTFHGIYQTPLSIAPYSQ
uniref:Tyrosine-protein kinase ephrin type A/B receptor-like domain-containing protein n=1 Tax=Denticeps clupeoides TaxID=299321 RepID=A0AAY4DU20_9TELE